MEMFNALLPLFEKPPELVAKGAEQIVKINEEDPKDWLPDSFLQYLKDPQGYAQQQAQQAKPNPKVAESINYKDAPPEIQRQIEAQAGLQPAGSQQQGQGAGGAPGGAAGAQGGAQGAGQGAPGPGNTMQGQQNLAPEQTPTVVPKGQVNQAFPKGIFTKKL